MVLPAPLGPIRPVMPPADRQVDAAQDIEAVEGAAQVFDLKQAHAAGASS